MRIAHLSDLHALELTGVRWTRFLNKRITGLANLRGSRRDAHPLWLLDTLVEAVRAQAVDHVVITGDVSNLSLESEFEAVRSRLMLLGGPDRVSLIPGNHDIYTRGAARARRFETFFGPWLGWEDPRAEVAYPWFKALDGGVRLFGFRSAVPRAPLIATGAIDAPQLSRFASLAETHLGDGAFGIALIHHNLHKRRWHKNLLHGLRRRDRVLSALEAGGVRLLLHGHTHVAHRFSHGAMDVIGCGSSTWNSPIAEHRARFNIYTISEGQLAGVEVFTHDPEAGTFRGP